MSTFTGGQDWDEVRFTPKVARTKEDKKLEIKKAARAGTLQAERKYAAGTNKQVDNGIDQSKLEADDEKFGTATVSHELKKLIMQCRSKAGMTQKDLATACNVKANIIQDYESGKGVPNAVFIRKIESAIRQKDPTFVPGTFTKAHKAAMEKKKAADAKAKAAKKKATGTTTQKKGNPGPTARSRRF